MCSVASDAERACERLTASFRSDRREDDRFAADPVEKGFTLAPGQVSACPAVSCSEGQKPDGGFTGCVADFEVARSRVGSVGAFIVATALDVPG